MDGTGEKGRLLVAGQIYGIEGSSLRGLGNEAGQSSGLLCFHFHLEVVLVQPTLRLLLPPGPSPRTLPRIPLAALRRAVPVTHAPISLLQQLVVRDVVPSDVRIHIVERPREERVQLQQPRLVYLERL